MKNIAFLIFILTVTGCQSMNDVRNDGTVMTFESGKNTDDVAQCILLKWQNEKDIFGVPFGAFLQPLPKGKTVYVNGNYYIADVTADSYGKTMVKFYQMSAKNHWIETTKSCI